MLFSGREAMYEQSLNALLAALLRAQAATPQIVSTLAVPVTSSGWSMTGAGRIASGDRELCPTVLRGVLARAGRERANLTLTPYPPGRRFPLTSMPGNWRPMCDAI